MGGGRFVGWCLTALLAQIGYTVPWSFQKSHFGAHDKRIIIQTRNKSIVPCWTMHTGRILSRAYAAIREWS